MTVPRTNGFPLSALFLLMGSVALLMTGARAGVTNSMTWWDGEDFARLGGIGFVAAIVGAVIAVCLERRLRAVLLGFLTGGVVGYLAGLQLMIPHDIRAVAVGVFVLLAACLVYRRMVQSGEHREIAARDEAENMNETLQHTDGPTIE
jgi:hypothetical protein